VVEPGVVNTDMAANPFAVTLTKSFTPLNATDIARAIHFATDQPQNCSINEIVIRPTGQVL
jgi:NADP-dependent 3-hydroxy acid dehydrogenase YdfG